MTSILKRLVLPAAGLAILAATLTASTAPVGAVWDDAKTLYSKKCANCHGLDGSGNTAKGKEYKLKDLRSPEVQKMSDQAIFDLLSKGKGKMTGLGKTLSEAELKSLVAYTRQLAKK
jgi:mono/diheme cytochrome c family protein